MLLLLIKAFYWIIISTAWGLATVKVFRLWVQRADESEFPAPVYCILGLALLSCLVALLNFYIPIGLAANGIVAAIGACIILIYRKEIQTILKGWLLCDRKMLLVVVPVLLLACYFGTNQSIWIDEGVYHAQFIKWTETYSVVPGLGNLQHRLAFNSHWHLLAALMNASFITGQESNHINTFMYLVVFVYFLSGYKQLNTIRITAYFKLCCLVINAPSLYYYLSLYCSQRRLFLNADGMDTGEPGIGEMGG
jgi:hypothetical protein